MTTTLKDIGRKARAEAEQRRAKLEAFLQRRRQPHHVGTPIALEIQRGFKSPGRNDSSTDESQQ